MAFQEADPVAMGGLLAPEHSTEAFIWGMWVAPDWRGQGLGSRILEELLAWGRRLNWIVALHVTEGNGGARRLYETHGFASTGEWQPLREGSDLRMETLRQQRA
jgi:GNAT superfamily N-acetyltransferase